MKPHPQTEYDDRIPERGRGSGPTETGLRPRAGMSESRTGRCRPSRVGRAFRCAAAVVCLYLTALPSAGQDPARTESKCPGPGRAVRFQSIGRGVIGELREKKEFVIRDAKAWNEAWAGLGLPLTPAPATPSVDFSSELVVGVSAGQGKGVIEIEIKSAELRGECLVLLVSERKIPQGMKADQFESFRPFHFVRLRASPARVEFLYFERLR